MRIHKYGDPSVIRDDEVPQPVPGPGEVLIRVAGTSFNPSEAGLRRGLLQSVFPAGLPYVLGGDVAGVVVEAGSAAGSPAVGSRVIGLLDGGAAADFVAAPADRLVGAPQRIPLADAAALPIAGLTAWQAVFEHGGVGAGRRVLINGAGAVGRIAVRLARHAGADVTVVTASPDAAALRALGADRVVDRSGLRALGADQSAVTAGPGGVADRCSEQRARFDVVLNFAVVDAEGAAELERLGGVLVSATVPIGKHFVARNDVADLAGLVRLVDDGVVDPGVVARRPLAEMAAVHRDAEAGRLPGKTVLTP